MVKRQLSIIVISSLLLFVPTSNVLAAINITPVVTYNIHVMKNVSASQCPSSWNGNTSPEEVNVESGLGTSSVGAVGMQSCVNCVYQSSSGDCVCKTCYSYFD